MMEIVPGRERIKVCEKRKDAMEELTSNSTWDRASTIEVMYVSLIIVVYYVSSIAAVSQ